MLKTDIEKGISGDESDVSNRKAAFGSNTYPRKKGKNFLVSSSLLIQMSILLDHFPLF